ncbi:hypothetical protein BCR43DRAFT_488272 [Syncephalastrum racemosum]|uniref:Uncharacterized protein n=1 Tax=Syncephalastrum racemosum TaxID=13706 RepID=A0A1X2HJS1_SYNRA|nr:hypothetical protein BCR43DRAFT_488272 [Syncephalastrum racemosum]
MWSKKRSNAPSTIFSRGTMSPRQVATKAYTLACKKLDKDDHRRRPHYHVRERVLLNNTMNKAEDVLNKRNPRFNRRVLAAEDDEHEYDLNPQESVAHDYFHHHQNNHHDSPLHELVSDDEDDDDDDDKEEPTDMDHTQEHQRKQQQQQDHLIQHSFLQHQHNSIPSTDNTLYNDCRITIVPSPALVSGTPTLI